MEPAASPIPASPASAPASRKAAVVVFCGEKPAKSPARGAEPMTRTSKP